MVVLTLGAAEVVLRVTGFGIIKPGMNFGVNTREALDRGRFLYDPDLFWKLAPTPEAPLRAAHPDEPLPPRARSRRILVMGDSCSRISTRRPPYSAVLERMLGGGPVEVWNAAVPGYTTWQGRVWLEQQLIDLEPEVAVVYYGWNDHWRATGITDRDYAGRLGGNWLRLGLLIRGPPDPPPLRVPEPDYHDNLTAIVERLEARGTRVILVAAPYHLTPEAKDRLVRTRYLLPGDDPVELHRRYLAMLRLVASENRVVVLDAASVFLALDRPRELLMRDGIHLTDDGHAVMAGMIAAILTAGPGEVPDTRSLTARAAAVLASLNEAP
jgi:lysophospholipase L1-like esterase